MKLELRKFAKFIDKTFIEGGKEAKEPVLLVSVAAVFKNPWDGQGFVEDLKPVILDLESVRVIKPGKFEIDIVSLFNKRRPLIYKLEEGKYIIDLSTSLKTNKDEIDKKIRDPTKPF